ncbi:MAG: immunoprotective protein Mpt64 [Mycobacterium sp.]
MRSVGVAMLITAAVLFESSGVAAAAPKNYCADLKGVDTGQACQIQISDPAYTVNIAIPSDYPDQKSLTDYITQTRDGFLNVAKSSAPRDTPYELDITSANYSSAIPPRGTQAVVFKVYQNVGGAHPQTMFKAFNWDQSYRKPISWDNLWQPTVDDPLKVVFPIVQSELQKQTGQPVAIAPTAGYDPMNYQDFAVTNDGVIFFFSQGQLRPEAAGATQVLVPRSAIDPMLA